MSEWGLDRLHSLTNLTIDSYPDHNMRLPTSLTDLSISDFKNLNSISNMRLGLPNLISLFIKNCPNFQSLPQEIGFPPTLGSLHIYYCPLVKERDLRSLFFHIPRVVIFDRLWFHYSLTSYDCSFISLITYKTWFCSVGNGRSLILIIKSWFIASSKW